MIRKKFGVLGVALVAAMAMSAFVASAAQAGVVLEAGKYSALITGTASGVGENFNTEAGKVTCEVSHYVGTTSETSPTLSVKPTYTNCQAFGFLEATVNTEGCEYVFHGTEHDAKTGIFTAHVDVVCPAGQSIKITAGTCKAEVKGQTGLTTADIVNMNPISPATKDDLTVTPTLWAADPALRNGKNGPVAYTVTQDGFLCPFSGTGAKTGGEYSTPNGAITVQAFEDLGVHEDAQGNLTYTEGAQVTLTATTTVTP